MRQRTWRCVVVWVVSVSSWVGLFHPLWAAPSVQDEQADTQLWLADEGAITVLLASAVRACSSTWSTIFYDDVNVYDKPQGDQGADLPAELCPPVPATLPEGSCRAQKCHSDRECGESGTRKCCYNGCIYTCLPVLAPPAFLDWLREPRRRLSSGLSWLVTGPDEANEEEPCSTTPVDPDADPLVCPQGYYCSIFDGGDPVRGVPNQGLCHKLADDAAGQSDSEMGSEDAKVRPPGFAVTHAHACDLGGRMLLEGHVIVRDGQQCICRRRQLACEEQKDD